MKQNFTQTLRKIVFTLPDNPFILILVLMKNMTNNLSSWGLSCPRLSPKRTLLAMGLFLITNIFFTNRTNAQCTSSVSIVSQCGYCYEGFISYNGGSSWAQGVAFACASGISSGTINMSVPVGVNRVRWRVWLGGVLVDTYETSNVCTNIGTYNSNNYNVCCSAPTNAGSISGYQSNCGTYDPGLISNSSGASGGSGGSIVYQWQQQIGSGSWTNISGATGTTFDPPTITQTTNYRRLAQRNCGSTWVTSNTVTKEVLNPITPTVNVTQPTCSNPNGTIQITNMPNGYWTRLSTTGWSQNVSVYNNLSPGTYEVWLGAANCDGMTTVTINPVPTGPNLICEFQVNGTGGWNGGDCTAEVCVGEQLHLSVNPNNMASYQWSGPNGFSATGDWGGAVLISNSITAAHAGTYNVTATDGSGCTSVRSMSVLVNTVSGGTIGSNQTVCSGGDPNALTNTAHGSTAGTRTYRWESSTTNCSTGFSTISGATGATYNPPAGITQTTYFRRRTISTLNGKVCEAISNCVTLSVTPSPVPVCEFRVDGTGGWNGGNCSPVVCAGQQLELSVNPNNLASYQWSGPNGFSATGDWGGAVLISNAITTAQAGTYTVTLTDANGCTAVQDIAVTVNAGPQPICAYNIGNGWVNNDCTIWLCENEPLTLSYQGCNANWNVVVSGPNGFSGSTNGGCGNVQVSNSVTSAMAGNYTFTVTDQNGCSTSNVFSVNINTNPNVTSITHTDETCAGNDGSITFNFTDDPGRTNIEFSIDGGTTWPGAYNVTDNAGSLTISNLAPGNYDLWVRWGNDECPVDLPNRTVQPASGCTEICDNGLDDDGDGLIDCADPDCETEGWLNNGFEDSGSTVFNTFFEGITAAVIPNNTYIAPNWYVTSGCGGTCEDYYYIDDSGGNVNNPEGDKFVWLPGSGYCLRQTVSVEAGKCYEMSFQGAPWSVPGPQEDVFIRFDVFGGGIDNGSGGILTLHSETLSASGNSFFNLNWQEVSFVWTAPITTTTEIYISPFNNATQAKGLAVDDLHFREVCCPAVEICDNGLDDDGDGLIDCGDTDCPSCTDIPCSDGVVVISQKTAIATGSGPAGTPSLTDFFVPAGNNRAILVLANFEREHCQSGDVCNNSNTSGTGLGDNYASPNLVSSGGAPQITADFTGSGGTVSQQNPLTMPSGDLRFLFQAGIPSPPGSLSAAYYSRESYFIALYESDIQTILGGAASGNISITLPGVTTPIDNADDAILMAYTFVNVEQSVSGIVRSGAKNLNSSDIIFDIINDHGGIPGDYTLTLSDLDNGQEPDEAADGFLIFGLSGIGQPSGNGGFLTSAGFTELDELQTNTPAGDFTTFNEADGFSVSAQFRNGPTSGIINAASMQSAASSAFTCNGGMMATFTIESAACTEICDNGLDDDGDGLVDCADPDCANSFTVNTNATAGTICRGGNTTISASASGGTGPYTYNWSNGLGNGVSHNITPLNTTTYTVTVTSAPGCTSTAQVTVTVNLCAEDCTDGIDNDGDGLVDCDDPDCGLSLTATPTHASCGNNDGQVTITASGGSGSYEFSDDNSTWQGGNTFTGLAPNSYTFYARNDDGTCSTSVNADVEDGCENCTDGLDNDGDGLTDCADPDCAPVASAGSNISICTGNSTTLTASATGGTTPYTYAWDNGLGAGSSHTVTPGSTTTYTVTVTSTTGCTSSAQVTVTVAPCAEDCTDGIDNDGDGLIDCDDPDCQLVGMPQPVDDVFNTCPGIGNYGNLVSINDGNLQNPAFTIVTPPSKGSVVINNFGAFNYTPADSQCGPVSFTYEVCNQATGCCATATATIHFGDSDAPVLQNVPADLTISCDDEIPVPPVVTATDFCPYITIDLEETDNLGSLGTCENYTITRTWTTTDICGNSASQSQQITVTDQTKPEMFRVYTLANGSQLVAGNAPRTSHLWKYVKFPIHFNTPPLVFAQVTSENDGAAVTVQTRYISTTGFEVRLREEEGADGIHAGEMVSWMAMEEGSLSGSTQLYSGLLNNVTHNNQSLSYPSSFPSRPVLIASVNGMSEADPVTVRTQAETSSGVQLSLQEEQSGDGETDHAPEKVAWLAMTNGAELNDEHSGFVAESGTVTTNHTWMTVTLSRTYNKPVVILGGMSTNGNQAAVIRVRNVTQTSFEVRVQEWDYLDGGHANESLNFVVVEGSIPTDNNFYCFNNNPLQPGVDVIAIDNCDGQVAFGYNESANLLSTGLQTIRTWIASDDCGNVNLLARYDTCRVAAVRLQALLGGGVPLFGGNIEMHDDLRQKQLVPVKEPYTGLPDFEHRGMGGDEAVSPAVFDVAGSQAVTDWLFVECRAAGNDEEVLSTCSVLLQRDGTVQTAEGSDVLYFWDLPEGDYYVSVRHRNHLGLMTDGVWHLCSDNPPLIDFTELNTGVIGGATGGTLIKSKRAMWAGDFNSDGKAIYQGPYNDVFFLFSKVLDDPGNTNFLANFISAGYHREDFNLDGRTIYQGPGNDRSMVLYHTVLSHAGNTWMLANYIVVQGLP